DVVVAVAHEARNDGNVGRGRHGIHAAGDPVFAAEGSGFGNRLQLLLELIDFFLDLDLVNAFFRSRYQLGLDFLDDVDGAFLGGIVRVDLGRANANRVLYCVKSQV